MLNYSQRFYCFLMVFVNALHFQTSGNTNPNEKDLRFIKKKIITCVINPKAIKPNCFSKAKKPTAKATPNAPIGAVNPIAKTVRYENNAAERPPSLKSWTTASIKNITTACIKSSHRMKNMPRKCRECGAKR